MRRPPEVPKSLAPALLAQDGVLTSRQLRDAGLSVGQLQTLTRNGWARPTRGIYVTPDAPDPFIASLRVAVLARPGAVLGGVSAARLHGLWGLPPWTPDEDPHLWLPRGATYNWRRGVRVHAGLLAGEATTCRGFPVTSLARTVMDASRRLSFDDTVCLLDSALRQGWRAEPLPREALRLAAAAADARSESPLETVGRLIALRAGLPTPVLQYPVQTDAGSYRLDMAWPEHHAGAEGDGRQFHDLPTAVYRDRERDNALRLSGWTVMRYTWQDVRRRPAWVADQLARALTPK